MRKQDGGRGRTRSDGRDDNHKPVTAVTRRRVTQSGGALPKFACSDRLLLHIVYNDDDKIAEIEQNCRGYGRSDCVLKPYNWNVLLCRTHSKSTILLRDHSACALLRHEPSAASTLFSTLTSAH